MSNPSRGIGGADGGTYEGAMDGVIGGATKPIGPEMRKEDDPLINHKRQRR